MRPFTHALSVALLLGAAPCLHAQVSSAANLPRVVIPTSRQPIQPARPAQQSSQLYPWRQNITATVFWIGERPTQNNPTPNHKSSWDQQWAINYGGYDDPDPNARHADHRTSEFRPKHFTPKLNPFYIALPYNDVAGWGRHKPEASRVIPWFRRMNPKPGKTVLKGRWVQIYHGGRSCYAQWEDCGPWVTDDYHYVFGNSRPKNRSNSSAGIDISPAIRDYLDLKSGEQCHWRFVEDVQVPYGPWKKYGQQRPSLAPDGTDFEAKRKYLEYLRKLRDEQYQKQSLDQIRH
ncbi:hypothetical protein ACFQY0_15465 [Haloferula chungangensis]|uniref:Uncharacterized protein n=1 Tax=Haloferula chungangensis TaxID=1048331 RepID=A0ABW2LB48_9BACT